MVIDTSALIAILLKEAEAEQFFAGRGLQHQTKRLMPLLPIPIHHKRRPMIRVRVSWITCFALNHFQFDFAEGVGHFFLGFEISK